MFSRRLSIGLIAVLAGMSFNLGACAGDKARVLVYSGSTGYRHASIPAAVASIKALGEKAGYVIDTSEDAEVFTAENLVKYKALVLVSTRLATFDEALAGMTHESLVDGRLPRP